MAIKRNLFLLILLIISLLLTGFYIYKQFIEEKPKVVVVLKAFDIQYWNAIRAGAEKGFEDFGIDGKVVVSKNGTLEEQRNVLDAVLKENPDVLVVSPVNSDIIPKLEEFTKHKIPVLLISTDIPWKKKSSYIGTDNIDSGKKAGILMASLLQPGEKVALLGRKSLVEEERLKGAKMSLDAAGVNIVVSENKDFPFDQPDSIEKEMKKILQEHPDLNGVLTSSDYVALPVFKIIREQGLEIPVTGADGDSDILQLINNGEIAISIVQNPYDMGYLSVENAFKISKGEKVEKYINSGVDIITKENAKQRIEFYDRVLK